jgi:hypothetical protein
MKTPIGSLCLISLPWEFSKLRFTGDLRLQTREVTRWRQRLLHDKLRRLGIQWELDSLTQILSQLSAKSASR